MAGFHAGPLTTSGPRAQPGNPLRVQVYQGADDPGISQDMRTAFTVRLSLLLYIGSPSGRDWACALHL